MYTYRWRVRVSSWWRKLKDERARRARTETDHLRGGFSPRIYVPIQQQGLFLEERIIRYLRKCWDNIRIAQGLFQLGIVEVINGH
jgi:hypothetical protein